jgi:hypothetical protein
MNFMIVAILGDVFSGLAHFHTFPVALRVLL